MEHPNNASVQKAKEELQKVFNTALAAPIVADGRNTKTQIIYPDWKNIINTKY